MSQVTRFGFGIVLALVVAPALVAWTNGQNALFVIGQADFVSATPGLTATTVSEPKDVAVDVANNKLYVCDTRNNRVLRYAYPLTASQPTAELVFGQADFTSSASGTAANLFRKNSYGPHGIAVDATGRLWVADSQNNRVVWFDTAHLIAANQPSADGVLGQADFTSFGSATTATGMDFPMDLVVANNGTLFVTDQSNHRVLRFDDAAAKANGAAADGVLGQLNFTSGASGLSARRFEDPRGVALIGASLFVTDRTNARVLRFDNALAKANGARANGVLGQLNFTSSTLATSQSGVGNTSRVVADATGTLYVTEGFLGAVEGNDRVMIWANAKTLANGAPADNVLGQPDFVSTGSGLGPNRLRFDSSAGGLAFDRSRGLLFVADEQNNRVLVFSDPSAVALPVPALSPAAAALATLLLLAAISGTVLRRDRRPSPRR